ncbi:MAG: OmpA family protein [Candidatus Cryptobacteroides sp.]
MNSKRILLVFAAAVLPLVMSAQQSKTDETVEFRPHWSLQLQGGAAYTLGETSFGDLVSPAVFVNANYKFIPALGLRLGIGGWQGKGCQVTTEELYAFKFAQLNADLMLDLTSLFGGFNHKRLCTAYILGGVGGVYGFKNDEAAGIVPELEYLWDKKFFVPGRLGAGVDFRLGEKVSLGVEANANALSDHFNSKRADNADWHFNLLAGLSVRFGKNNRPAAAYLAAASAAEAAAAKAALEAAEKEKADRLAAEKRAEEEAAARTAAEQEAAERALAEKLREEHARAAAEHSDNVYFLIGSAKIREGEAAKVQQIAQWLKDNPDFTVAVVGYADKETGNAATNLKLSENRAENVKALLVSEGVDADRIVVDWKGDTEQPFFEQERNRVVICTLE